MIDLRKNKVKWEIDGGKMKKHFDFIIVFLVVVIVLFMSIGYSVLNKDLNITGELTYRPQEDIRITNFTANGDSPGINIEYADFSKKEIKLGYTSASQASITYTVEVTNSSNVPMGILKIDGLEDNLMIEIQVQENILGKKLVDGGETATFTVTFNILTVETKAISLKFDFEPIYTVSYHGFSNTENFLKEVLKGATYSQDFGNGGPGALYITMNGNLVDNYTYSNKVLTITNVSGNIDITILMAKHLAYDNSESGLNCSDIQCAIDEINRMIK